MPEDNDIVAGAVGSGIVLAALGLYYMLWYNLTQVIFSLVGDLKGTTVMLAEQGLVALFLVCSSLVVVAGAICATIYKLRRLDMEDARRKRLDDLDREIALAQGGIKKLSADDDTLKRLVDGLHERGVKTRGGGYSPHDY